MKLVLSSHFLVFTLELPHKLSLINLVDNSLVTFNDFHASAMAKILSLPQQSNDLLDLMNLYQLDQTTCQREMDNLIQYLLEKGIVTNNL